MFSYNGVIGIDSGYLQTFIIFAIPALFFILFSLLPMHIPILPKRVIAGIAFGIGALIIIKQIPIAFGYESPDGSFTMDYEESSFLSNSSLRNWIQLGLALVIPVIALIGRKYKKSQIALLAAMVVTLLLGYLLGYDTSSLELESFTFSKSFQLDWKLSPEILFTAIQSGITVTIIMLLSFWMDFSTLNYDRQGNKKTIKKSLLTVGIGNLVGGIFGIMPVNVSLVETVSIRSLGGYNWLSKLPIIIVLLYVAIIGLPDINVPLFAFSGVLIYLGCLLIIQSWNILKELLHIDYVFIFLIGLIILLQDLTTGFIVAMLYAGIVYLLNVGIKRKEKSQSIEQEEE